MTHCSPTPHFTKNLIILQGYTVLLCNYKLLHEIFKQHVPCKKADVVYNTIGCLILTFCFLASIFVAIWVLVMLQMPGGLNFMLLYSSFLDATLLLQQNLLAVFTASQTYFHWQQAWTNVARVWFCYSKEELCSSGDRYSICGGFSILLPKWLYNFVQTQHRKLRWWNHLYDSYAASLGCI